MSVASGAFIPSTVCCSAKAESDLTRLKMLCYSQNEYDILVITVSRQRVNNKDIIRMHLGYNWLISQKTVPINASFVKQQAMASGYVHLSKLSLYNKQY